MSKRQNSMILAAASYGKQIMVKDFESCSPATYDEHVDEIQYWQYID